MGGFTHEEIEGAKLGRQTQGRVGNPPYRVFKKLIGTNDLKNNPVTIENVADAFAIFGSNVNRLDTKGDWQVVIPEWETIPFQRDKGMCVGMPYIDLRKFKQGIVLIETVRKNMGVFNHEEI